MSKAINLLPHQVEFIEDTTTPFVALCGGFRSGKSYAAVYKAIKLAIINAPLEGALVAPTFSMARNILAVLLKAALESCGIKYKFRKSSPMQFILHLPQGDTIIHLLSAENFNSNVGLTLAWFGVDEADRIDPVEKAFDSWNVLVSRLTNGKAVQGFATSTPEGYGWMYQYFDAPTRTEKQKAKRRLIRAKSQENPFIREDYFEDQRSTWPEKQLKAYLDGEFVNLTDGNVYECFDRDINKTDKVVADFDNAESGFKVPLHVGMDFNVRKCTAVVHVISEGKVYAVDLLWQVHNTQAMVNELHRRYPNRQIYVYPDSSGQSEHTNASATDIALLKMNFSVRVPKQNPYIRDRVDSMNAMFRNAKGAHRYFVNLRSCKEYVQCLEQQGYKNGTPDKSGGLDHAVDAAGYFIFNQFGITKSVTSSGYARGSTVMTLVR